MLRHLLSLLLLVGCSRSFEPPRAFVGTAQEKGRAEIDVGPGAKPGEVIVNWWNTDRPRGDLEVKVERVGDKQLRVQVGGCGVLFDQNPAPNDHGGRVTIKPMQVCEVDIDHYKGPVYVGGTVQFDRDKGTVSVLLHGNAPNGSATRVQWSLNYDGVAKK